ncbi:MAG TPA: YdcF family protein [Bauldia sp.]|nr:YdcF family protein [Bauldia sp.]
MRIFARLTRGLLLLSGAVVVALVVGFVAFAVGIADAAPPADPRAEGIVVLTGGSARIDGALRLLADHRASRLLISGVNPAVGIDALAGTLGADLDAMLACCVDLGHTARDTIGNATETRDWAADNGYTSLIVVTSAYHMPRSLAELHDAMPRVTLIAYPVSNPELHLTEWWGDPEAFSLLVREYGKYLLTAARLAIAPSPPGPTNVAGG